MRNVFRVVKTKLMLAHKGRPIYTNNALRVITLRRSRSLLGHVRHPSQPICPFSVCRLLRPTDPIHLCLSQSWLSPAKWPSIQLGPRPAVTPTIHYPRSHCTTRNEANSIPFQTSLKRSPPNSLEQSQRNKDLSTHRDVGQSVPDAVDKHAGGSPGNSFWRV